MTKVEVEIDASTFMEPIGRLAETMAQQVKRSGLQQRGGPEGLHQAAFMAIRQVRYTYNFLYFVHSDDIHSHCGWRREYILLCPLVRTLIVDLYNISALLDDPQANRSLHMTGFRSESLMLERVEKKYSGIPEWDEYIRTTREKFDRVLRHFGYTESEVRALKPEERWPTNLTAGEVLPFATYPPNMPYSFRPKVLQ